MDESAAAAEPTDGDAERRAEWRRFVREHHPDRGGDPVTFASGVRNFREGRSPWLALADRGAGDLTTHRSTRGLGRVTRWVRRRWDAKVHPRVR